MTTVLIIVALAVIVGVLMYYDAVSAGEDWLKRLATKNKEAKK